MVLKGPKTGLGVYQIIPVLTLVFVIAVAISQASYHDENRHASWHAHYPPGNRWKRQTSPNVTFSVDDNNSTEAKRIVKAAQAEAAKRNKYLVEHVRRNHYTFTASAKISSAGGEVNDTLATGFNNTVTAAAAVVAQSLSSGNKTTTAIFDKRQASSYWMANMVQNGVSPFAPSGYRVWRNVKDFGAVGDGVTDDTAAINLAISSGGRCGLGCGSTSTLFAVVYFPPGTYLVSSSIIQYYMTQLVGDASNFFRQVRNFVLDITTAPLQAYVAAIHWQIAQATSLENIKFVMSSSPGNNQQGIFMENGSGGLLNDLEFEGGALGAYLGNQQFTVRNLKFRDQLERAVEIHWDWGWTWKGVDIANGPIGVIMLTPGVPTEVGSAIFIDSAMSNVALGFKVQPPMDGAKVSLSLFSLSLSNVPTVVQYDGGATLLTGTSGSTTIAAWGLGKRYDTTAGEDSGVWQDGTAFPRAPIISSGLLKDPGLQTSGFFERSKPQYESLPASAFVNLKSVFGAVGNGVADDTSALNTAFASAASSGLILWIPAGVYIVTDTVLIPPGVKVVGQVWSQIMGSGGLFSHADEPRPVVKVGKPGDVGSVEIQDLLFTVRGATAGAVVLQWNIRASSPGSAAMWDAHVRVGGAAGSDLQVGDCPKLTGSVNPKCVSASMLVHITKEASAYFENTWFWVADHDLDIPAQTQIDVYVARGFLIESTHPTWLYATASEHCVLYQYQTLNAANVFMGMIQTEAPYYQVAPRAPAPFTPGTFAADPTFDYCDPASTKCAVSWGVRFINSESIYLYGAGLYSWFSEYSQVCVALENCQDRIFEIDGTSDVWIYSLITKASIEMVSPYEGTAVLAADNKIGYCSIVMAWLGGSDTSEAGGKKGVSYKSPILATVISFPATTVPKSQTFTLGGAVSTDVAQTPNGGHQNTPDGPNEDRCLRCDLMRLITSTCCGVGGSIGNPVTIQPGASIPRPLILPQGFAPNQPVTDANTGITYPAGQPLEDEVTIDGGTTFPFPFSIPAGQPFSDTFTPDEFKDDDDDDEDNNILYITSDFWDQPHTVFCHYPCTLIFPPWTITTTFTPPPFTTTVSGTVFSTTPPPQTTEKLKIKKTTVRSTEGSSPTHVISPITRPDPICIRFTIPILGITIQFGFCPPKVEPLPPIPQVTIKPPPPGTKSGPININNEPTSEQWEERDEDEDEDEEEMCDYGLDYDNGDPTSGMDGWPGGPDNPNIRNNWEYGPMADPPAAGIGNPTTSRVTTTISTPRPSSDQPANPTSPNPDPLLTPVPVPDSPPKPKYDAGTETSHCYYDKPGLLVRRSQLEVAVDLFCIRYDGVTMRDNEFHAIAIPISGRVPNARLTHAPGTLRVGVYGRNNVQFRLTYGECSRVLKPLTRCYTLAQPTLGFGGSVEANAAVWVLEPSRTMINSDEDCSIWVLEDGSCY
ncbi:pectate lyase superfamily protein-domain-containing protein [Chaetomium fimeti]|uniref:Pectate lyase superfamily protein-domain-containing protein n=1 Tax=Chaetomium fimeti TaxID=1854472 RepID=A0AAE0HH75_9PEZI|nr:pectate lyase superfamily protein-domain-containing protein [Chaetomium fimeti]